MFTNAIEWLEQAKKLDEMIIAKKAEYEEIFTNATNISSKLDDMPTASGGINSDKVGNGGVNLGDLANEIEILIQQCLLKKEAMGKILEQLPAKEYGVLHRYYIRYMTEEEIADDMFYSTRHIRRIKDKGIKLLENVLKCPVI